MGERAAELDLASGSPRRLTGDGLILREWRLQDVDSMVALFDDPEIASRTPLPAPFTTADAQERVSRAREPDRLMLAVTLDGKSPLGEVLLTSTGELGYMIGAEHRGQGLAARALVLLRDYAFEALEASVVYCRVDSNNIPSQRVAIRAGFRRVDAPAESGTNKGRPFRLEGWKHARKLPDPSRGR